MAKNNTLLYLAGAAALYFIATGFKKPDTPDTSEDTGNGNTGGSNTGSGTPTTTYNYPIFWMTYHPDVKLLQMALGVDIDGKIGNQTASALYDTIGVSFNRLSQIASRSMLDLYIQQINAANSGNDGTGSGGRLYPRRGAILQGCNMC